MRETAETLAQSGRPKVRILLVEDDLLHAKLVLRAFREAPFDNEVEIATTLQDAREKLAKRTPNLVISDLILPDGHGIELIPEDLKARSFPLIVLTSQGSESAAVEAMKAGALDYIVKTEDVLLSSPRFAERVLREWKRVEDLRRAEASIQQALQLCRGIIDSMPAHIAVLDGSGHILATNQAWQSYEAPESLFGKDCLETDNYVSYCEVSKHPHGKELAFRIRNVLCGNFTEAYLEHSVTVNEKTRWFETLIRPFQGQESQRIVLIHNDITHRKQVELEAVARAEALTKIGGLTTREAEVMQLVVDGKPNKSIARKLNISVKTVEMHRSNLMKKLELSSVADLVKLALLADPTWATKISA